MNSSNYILVTYLSDIESKLILFFVISAWFWLTYPFSSIDLRFEVSPDFKQLDFPWQLLTQIYIWPWLLSDTGNQGSIWWIYLYVF